MKIINDEPHASTFVFIKTRGSWSPEDALAYLGIKEYQKDQSFDDIGGRLWFYDDGEWMHILDGWDYRLLNNQLPKSLIELSRKFDVLMFYVGDSDMSFSYAIYEEGKCKRNLKVESPAYTDKVVEQNEGKMMSCEEGILSEDGKILISEAENYIEVLLDMAFKLGVDGKYTEDNLQVYRLV